MTVAAIAPEIAYVETGSPATTYAVPFQFRDSADLVVTRTVAGLESAPLAGSAIAVTGSGPLGTASIQLAAPVEGATLRIRRATARSQGTDLTYRGDLPSAEVEAQLDRMMMAVQEQDLELGRAPRVPRGDVAPALPLRSAMAGMFLAGDATGDNLVPASGTGADAALRADLAASAAGASLVSFLFATGLTAMDLRTALRLGLPVMPEFFGAVGDGVANDTAAFTALSAHVQATDGGSIMFRRGATYLVGAQTAGGAYDGTTLAYAPADIITLTGCTRPIIIDGNGATLKAAPGLRFGGWNSSGDEVDPYSVPSTQAWPYVGMIYLHENSGDIVIRNLELDGNSATTLVGGSNGVDGIQLPGAGLYLIDNSGQTTIENVRSHHHPLDGLLLRTPASSKYRVNFLAVNLTCEYNGRQGVSDLGGYGHRYINLRTNHTGKGAISSAPSAGIDIEPDSGGIARVIEILGHESVNNAGPAFGADSQDSADIEVTNFLWNGTTATACYLNKPRISLRRGTILGTIANVFDATSWRDAVRMEQVLITDQASLSPAGAVYAPAGYLITLATDRRLDMNDCDIVATGAAAGIVSPGSTPRLRDLRITEVAPSAAGGTYFGHCDIVSPSVFMGNAVNRADVLAVNGLDFSDLWQSFTPAIGATVGGPPTAATGTCFYRLVGDICHLWLQVAITTNGTAAENLTATAPFKAARDGFLPGHVRTIAGIAATAKTTANSNLLHIVDYNNSYPGADGKTIVIQGSYQVRS